MVLGEPVFEKKAVWIPSDRGLFVFDREGRIVTPVPLGGVLLEGPIDAVSLKGGSLRVESKKLGSWSLDLSSRKWSR